MANTVEVSPHGHKRPDLDHRRRALRFLSLPRDEHGSHLHHFLQWAEIMR
jgi:hypothetical protein